MKVSTKHKKNLKKTEERKQNYHNQSKNNKFNLTLSSIHLNLDNIVLSVIKAISTGTM